jgi:hypothetical protein
VLHQSLVNRNILSPFHIKLGIMKSFVKATNMEGDRLLYVKNKFAKSK